MNLTLLVENNPQIQSFYKLNLLTWLGLESLTISKGEAAVKYLESNSQNVNLIIVRNRIEKEQTGKLLTEYLKLKGLKIPLIILGPGDYSPQLQVANSLDLKLLIKTAASALGITAQDMGRKVVPDFFPIPLLYFKFIKRPICRVYQQEPGRPGSYSLVFDKLKDFEPATLDKLTQLGVEQLFVDKMDRLEFVSNVTSELMSVLKVDDISEDEVVTATDKSIGLLSKKLLTIGITEETISLAQRNIKTIQSNVKKNPSMSKLLNRLMKNKASYLYKHTEILTYVAMHIVHNIEWGNSEQEEKICFIAFFHDIVLESDEQCKISSNNELKRSTLTAAEKTLVEKHAQMAAEYVQKFPHAPMGTDQIIRQHHGQLNGIGFSDHYGANVSPMAVVFIVAEEFTRIIMNHEGETLDREAMLKELKEEFPTSRFAKVIETLQDLIL